MKYSTPNSIIALTSDRQGGSSKAPYNTNNMSHIVGDKIENVNLNRQQLADEVKMPLTQWVFVKQCHSDIIKKVDLKDGGRGSFKFEEGIENADALYTYDSNLMIAFMHADCVPILMYDETTHLIVAIHAGWQGTLQNITTKSLQHLIEHEKINPQNLQVIIGPSLSYENSRIDTKDVPYPYKLNKNIQLDENNNLKVNAAQLNIEECLACGILPENITHVDEDTYQHPQKYFSFQRDGITGRHITAIGRV